MFVTGSPTPMPKIQIRPNMALHGRKFRDLSPIVVTTSFPNEASLVSKVLSKVHQMRHNSKLPKDCRFVLHVWSAPAMCIRNSRKELEEGGCSGKHKTRLSMSRARWKPPLPQNSSWFEFESSGPEHKDPAAKDMNQFKEALVSVICASNGSQTRLLSPVFIHTKTRTYTSTWPRRIWPNPTARVAMAHLACLRVSKYSTPFDWLSRDVLGKLPTA